MVRETESTTLAPHGLFYMENAGGYNSQLTQPQTSRSMPADEHQPSCFAFEDEKGEGWKGSGASGLAINEARPRL